MTVVEDRDPCPSWDCWERRERSGGVAEAAELLGTTLHNSSFQ